MEFKEFQQHCKRTLPNLDKKYLYDKEGNRVSSLPIHLLDLIHMRLGIVSEFEELISAIRKGDKVNIGEELGDTLWYVANDLTICKKIGFIDDSTYNGFATVKFNGTPIATDGGYGAGENDPAWLSALVYNASIVQDHTKKYLAYGKGMPSTGYVKAISYLIGAINNISITQEIDLNHYMDKVIEKLIIRYPDKFSELLANNRNLEKERKTLES